MSTATDLAALATRVKNAETTLKTMATKNAARDTAIAALQGDVAALKNQLANLVAVDFGQDQALDALAFRVAALEVVPDPPVEPPPIEPPPAQPPARTTLADYVLTAADSGRTFERVDFVGTKVQSAALFIAQSVQDVTFKDFTIEGKTWNGVSINADAGRNIQRVKFEGGKWLPCARMGFECTARGGVYDHVDIVGCTFEPQGSEAISFDDDAHGRAAYCTVRDVLIKGAGNNPAYSWGQGLEINGPDYMTVDGLTLYSTRGAGFNLSGYGICKHWTFTDVLLDWTVIEPGQVALKTAAAQGIVADQMVNAVWQGTIHTAAPGGNVAWLSNCDNNDFRGVMWVDSRLYYATPTEVNGCSGNMY